MLGTRVFSLHRAVIHDDINRNNMSVDSDIQAILLGDFDSRDAPV
jgi:hypothetical protein